MADLTIIDHMRPLTKMSGGTNMIYRSFNHIYYIDLGLSPVHTIYIYIPTAAHKTTHPIVNSHRGIEVLWPKLHT